MSGARAVTLDPANDDAVDPPASKGRVKRQPLPRSGPSRSAATVFRSVPKAAPDDAHPPEPAKAARSRKRQGDGSRSASAKGAVEAAVNAAYRVCDDYVRWGRQAASQMNHQEERSEPMKRSGYDGYGGMPPMMQWWQDMACMWMSWMMPYAASQGYRDRDCRPTSCEPPRTRCPDVCVTVNSTRPAVAKVRLTKDPCKRELSAEIRDKPGAKAPSPSFTWDGDTLCVAITVGTAAEHPDGKYCWGIEDDSDSTLGKLTLQVGKS